MENGIPLGYYRNNTSGGLETLPWPERLEDLPPSLGFQIVHWGEQKLVHKDSGEPWLYTSLQKKWIVLWYAVNSKGDFAWRRGVMRMAKGTGKDPFIAALAATEMLGPTKFSHFDALTGRPIGQKHRVSSVLIAANSEAQAQETLGVANAMISDELKRETGFEAGKLGSSTPSGDRIKLMTSSERSSEGFVPTATFLNETHHMTETSGGVKVAKTANRNAAKVNTRVLETTNAHAPGAESVAEKSYRAWQNQIRPDYKGERDILYCSVEADPKLSFLIPEEGLTIVKQTYFYSPWKTDSDLKRLVAETADGSTPLEDSIRFYANGLAAAESAWVEPGNWDATTVADAGLLDGTSIALALDCSKSEDTTALVAVRISDGFPFLIQAWSKPIGSKGWLVPRDEVDAVVRSAHSTFNVVWFGVDPSPARDTDAAEYWAYLMDRWRQDFGHRMLVKAAHSDPIAFDMRLSKDGGRERIKQFTAMAQQVAQRVDEDIDFPHDDNPVLALHVKNARRRPNSFGISIGKETADSPHKIDSAAAMIIALVGRQSVIASGKTANQRSGVVYFV